MTPQDQCKRLQEKSPLSVGRSIQRCSKISSPLAGRSCCRRLLMLRKSLWLQKQLDAQLRNARHLQILAPIQPKTRDQVVLAAGRMAAQLKWGRLEMWRLRCHKDILTMDLEEERASDGSFPRTDVGGETPVSERIALARLHSKASTLGQQRTPRTPTAEDQQTARNGLHGCHLTVAPNAVELTQPGYRRHDGIGSVGDHHVVRGVALALDLDHARPDDPSAAAYELDSAVRPAIAPARRRRSRRP